MKINRMVIFTVFLAFCFNGSALAIKDAKKAKAHITKCFASYDKGVDKKCKLTQKKLVKVRKKYKSGDMFFDEFWDCLGKRIDTLKKCLKKGNIGKEKKHVKLFDGGVSNAMDKFYQIVEKECNNKDYDKYLKPGEEGNYAKLINKCYDGVFRRLDPEKTFTDMAIEKALKGAEN